MYGCGRMDGKRVRVQAVAEGWTMKNIPRRDDNWDCLSCAVLCIIAIIVIVVIAANSGLLRP
jgi:hypothetical protein